MFSTQLLPVSFTIIVAINTVLAHVVKVTFNTRVTCCMDPAHISATYSTFLYFRIIIVLTTQYIFCLSNDPCMG